MASYRCHFLHLYACPQATKHNHYPRADYSISLLLWFCFIPKVYYQVSIYIFNSETSSSTISITLLNNVPDYYTLCVRLAFELVHESAQPSRLRSAVVKGVCICICWDSPHSSGPHGNTVIFDVGGESRRSTVLGPLRYACLVANM